MLTTLLAASILAPHKSQDLTELYRQFTKGETWNYSVKAHLLTDTAQLGQSALPETIDFVYDWTANVKSINEAGFAIVEYKRPFITQIAGETADSPPRATKIPLDMHVEMQLSPINEITDIKELDKPKPKNGGGLSTKFIRSMEKAGFESPMAIQLGGFQQDLYQMALFIGSMETALDFNPKLPLDTVAVGETWKKTVSYQPQSLKGSKEQAVQRLDMEYKYDGIIEVNKVKVHRISATIHLDTDAALYINQMMGTTPGQSGLKSFPLKLDSKIVFDLDLKSKKTLRSEANTVGHWSVFQSGLNSPVVSEDLKGRATMTLK